MPTCLRTGGKAAERRDKIISAARKLFIENGFHATGVAQIAKESGVAVGQLYRDFASKEAIIAAIVAQDSSEFLIGSDIVRSVADGDEAAVWQWLREFLDPDPDCTNVLIADIVAEAARNPKVAGIFDGCHQQVHGALLQALEVLLPGPAMAEARGTMADMMLMLSLGLLQHDLIRGETEARRLADVAFASIRTQILAFRSQMPGKNAQEAAGPCELCGSLGPFD
nr:MULTISPECIES: TetR/AcrR family transcriptional regulator [unclassified Novosphingobium]